MDNKSFFDQAPSDLSLFPDQVPSDLLPFFRACSSLDDEAYWCPICRHILVGKSDIKARLTRHRAKCYGLTSSPVGLSSGFHGLPVVPGIGPFCIPCGQFTGDHGAHIALNYERMKVIAFEFKSCPFCEKEFEENVSCVRHIRMCYEKERVSDAQCVLCALDNRADHFAIHRPFVYKSSSQTDCPGVYCRTCHAFICLAGPNMKRFLWAHLEDHRMLLQPDVPLIDLDAYLVAPLGNIVILRSSSFGSFTIPRSSSFGPRSISHSSPIVARGEGQVATLAALCMETMGANLGRYESLGEIYEAALGGTIAASDSFRYKVIGYGIGRGEFVTILAMAPDDRTRMEIIGVKIELEDTLGIELIEIMRHLDDPSGILGGLNEEQLINLWAHCKRMDGPTKGIYREMARRYSLVSLMDNGILDLVTKWAQGIFVEGFMAAQEATKRAPSDDDEDFTWDDDEWSEEDDSE